MSGQLQGAAGAGSAPAAVDGTGSGAAPWLQRMAVATSAKAATVWANVQTALTGGGRKAWPKPMASTIHHAMAAQRTRGCCQPSAAINVASHRDGNVAYSGRNGLRIVARIRITIQMSGSRPRRAGRSASHAVTPITTSV